MQAIACALEYRGVDSRRILHAAGVQDALSNDPLQCVPDGAMPGLFQTCTDATRDPVFGLTVARFGRVSHMQALGYVLLASSTLRDFCRRLERYFKQVSQTARVELKEWDREAQLVSQLLHSSSLKPLRVEVAHPAPGRTSASSMLRYCSTARTRCWYSMRGCWMNR